MSNQVGITHVGLNTGVVPSLNCISVKGRVRQTGKCYVLLHGIVSIEVSYPITAKGSLYSPNFFNIFHARATCTMLNQSYYLCKAREGSYAYAYYLTQSKCSANNKRYSLVTGLLRGEKAMEYLCLSTIMSNGRNYLRAKGNIIGSTVKAIKAFGRILPTRTLVYSVTSHIGNTQVIAYACKGIKKVSDRANVVIHGLLQNNHGDWIYGVKGLVGAYAYLCSVPYKMQQFITNKRWFN